jgi:hypothetical protein
MANADSVAVRCLRRVAEQKKGLVYESGTVYQIHPDYVEQLLERYPNAFEVVGAKAPSKAAADKAVAEPKAAPKKKPAARKRTARKKTS